MGAVLALKYKSFFAGALLALSACGPLGDGVTSSTLKSFAAPVLTLGSSDAPSPQPAPTAGLTRAAIEAAPSELLLVSLVSRGSVDLLSQVTQTSTTSTWISSDGVSVSLKNGMLVGTRGSGFDLMGADTAAARQSLRGGGTHQRAYDTLENLDKIETATYSCTTRRDSAETITIVERDYAAVKWREDCESSNVRFTNLYWVGRSGEILQSRQFVSVGLGYLVYQRL